MPNKAVFSIKDSGFIFFYSAFGTLIEKRKDIKQKKVIEDKKPFSIVFRAGSGKVYVFD